MTKLPDDTQWRCRVEKDRFAALRTDERFQQIVVLGRALNSLRLLEITFISADDLPDPVWHGQRISAFLFMAAVGHETLELLNRMGRNFRDYPIWQERIAPILRNGLLKRLFKGNLAPLRDQVVFHFFENSILDPLRRTRLEEIVLIAGRGPTQGNVHFDLSDLLAIDLFLAEDISGEVELARLKELISRTMDLLISLKQAGVALVSAYCEEQGFILEALHPDGIWRNQTDR